MKAKLVENIEFKRGRGTKGALEIGGFMPSEIFEDLKKEAHEKWSEFARNLINKKIKFNGSKMGRGEWNQYEIEVKEVNTRYFSSEFAVMDIDDVWYTVLSSQKIYIE